MRIEHYLADRILHRGGSAQMLGFWGWTETDLDDIKIRHGAEFYLGKPVGRRKGRAEALKSTERLPANPHEDVEGVGFATGKGKGKMSSEDVERRCRAKRAPAQCCSWTARVVLRERRRGRAHRRSSPFLSHVTANHAPRRRFIDNPPSSRVNYYPTNFSVRSSMGLRNSCVDLTTTPRNAPSDVRTARISLYLPSPHG